MPTVLPRSWSEFQEALVKHFGSARRAQTNFCEQTSYTLSSVQHWRKTDKVPAEAFTALEAIDAKKCQPTTFEGYHTTGLLNRVVELSRQNEPLSSIAEKVSKEFNRKITENAVKGIRHRNRDRIGESYRQRSQEGD